MATLRHIFVLALCSCVPAQHVDMRRGPAHVEARQTSTQAPALDLPSASSTATIDPSQVSVQLASFLSEFPVSQQYTTIDETLGISVPSSLQVAIITAVPGSVLVELMDSSAKASVASEFNAGVTPAWYNSMQPDVKSWFEQFAREMSTGSPVFTVTSTSNSAAGTGEGSVEGPAAASSSSKAVGARPTGADWNVVASAVALAGVVGIGIAL